MPSVYKGCDGLAQGGVVDGGVSIKLCADLSCADLSCWPLEQGVGGRDRPSKQLGLVLTSDESKNPASTNRLGRIRKVTCATHAMSRRRWCQLAKRKKNSRPAPSHPAPDTSPRARDHLGSVWETTEVALAKTGLARAETLRAAAAACISLDFELWAARRDWTVRNRLTPKTGASAIFTVFFFKKK